MTKRASENAGTDDDTAAATAAPDSAAVSGVVSKVTATNAERGGELNNIPLANSNDGLVAGGEDTVQMMLWVNWDPRFEDLARSLDELKELAKGEVEGMNYLKSGFDDWLVNPNGFQLGKGRGPKFRWRLAWGGVALGMQKRESISIEKEIGNVWLIIGSEILIAVGGLKAVYELIVEKLLVMGGTVIRHKLSRVDACVDLADVYIFDFTEPFREGRYVCRAQSSAEHFEETISTSIHRRGRKDTGFSLGKKIMLRIYNKVLEVRHQPTKQALLIKKRWGYLPEYATRVEFEMKRDALKSFQIDTIEQWEEKKASVMKYLCQEWFRFVEVSGNRSNTSRLKVLPIWEFVAARFSTWTAAKPDTKCAERFKVEAVIDPQALLIQAFGCMTSAVVALKAKSDSIRDVLETAGNAMLGILDESEVQAKLRCKRLEFSATKPAFAYANNHVKKATPNEDHLVKS